MFPIKRLALGVVAACWSLSASAQITVVESLTGTLTADGTVLVTGTTPPDASPIQGYAYTGSPWESTSFYFGEPETGTTNLRVLAGEGIRARSTLIYTAQVSNTGTTAIDLSFSFFIGRGQVRIDSYSGNDFTADASLFGSITWGGNTLWGVDLDVAGSRADGVGSVVTNVSKTGAASDFSTFDSGDTIDYDPYAKTLGLGLLGAGESRTLVYTLEGEGYYTGTAQTEFYGYGGQAVVGAYDPFDFDGRPADFAGGVAAVPEPGTYAMLGIGLATLALARRRHRRRDGVPPPAR